VGLAAALTAAAGGGDKNLRVAAGVPASWKDYGFKLACHGDLVVEVAVEKGLLAKLTLRPGAAHAAQQRTLVLPKELVDEATLNRAVVTSVGTRGDRYRVEIRLDGPTEVVQGRQK
jgi:hypothetical protein